MFILAVAGFSFAIICNRIALPTDFCFKKFSKPIFERTNVIEFSWCLSSQRAYSADHTPRESYACDKPNHEKAANCLSGFQKPPSQAAYV